MTHVGVARQQILGEFAGRDVQSHGTVVVHTGSPRVRAVVVLRVIRPRPLGRHRPLGELQRLRVEHREPIAVEHAAPDALLRIHVPAPAARALGREVVPDGLQRFRVRLPYLVVRHLHAPRVVLRVGNDVVGAGRWAALRIPDGRPLVLREIHAPRAARLAGIERDVEPELAVDIHVRRIDHRQVRVAPRCFGRGKLERLHLAGLGIEPRDLQLRHVPVIDAPLFVEIDLQTALRDLSGATERRRVLDDLAGLDIELAEVLRVEIRVPRVAVRVEGDVVRRGVGARQVVHRVDHLRGLPLRPRQRLQWELEAVGLAQIDRAEISAERRRLGDCRQRPFLRTVPRVHRRGIVRVPRHARSDDRHLERIEP